MCLTRLKQNHRKDGLHIFMHVWTKRQRSGDEMEKVVSLTGAHGGIKPNGSHSLVVTRIDRILDSCEENRPGSAGTCLLKRSMIG